MIVAPLKTNTPLAITMLISTCIIFWISSFFFIPEHNSLGIDYSEGLIFSFLKYPFKSYSSLLYLIVILFSAFFINFLSIGQEIGSKSNFLPGFIYITLAFSNIRNDFALPLLLSVTSQIAGFYLLIKTYKEENVFSSIFISGICFGVACFFYTSQVLMLPVIIISLFILRPFNWREWVLLGFGLGVPLYLYKSISYLASQQMPEISSLIINKFSIFKAPILSTYSIPVFAMVGLFIISSLLSGLTKGFGAKIKTQKVKYIFLWLLLFSTLISFFNQSFNMPLYVCIFPLSILVGDYLSELKKIKLANLLLSLYLFGSLILYFHLLGFF